MLTIRLQRLGKKKQPTYRLVISEKTRDTQGHALEILGHYNTISGKTMELNEERIKYWLSKGAQASETVNNLLVKAGVITGAKKKSVAITKKRKTKMNEKVEAIKVAEEEKKAKVKAEAEATQAKAEESVSAEAVPDKAPEEKVEEVKE